MSIAGKLSASERESVYSGANTAIWHSHHLAIRSARRAAREEDYVATMVTDAVPLLGERWKRLLEPKRIAIKLSGVFCHGRPQVKFKGAKTPVELADLLIIQQHFSRARKTTRAMLVQAKMSDDMTHRLSSHDDQLALFSQWPPFEFVNGGLAPGLRDLKESGKGSRYALVLRSHAYPEDIEWADQCPWAACNAQQFLSADRSFAKLLGDMLLQRDGRTTKLDRPKDDWSKTIQELVTVTGKKTYSRTNIGRRDVERLSEGGSVPAGVLFMTESGSFGSGWGIDSKKHVLSDRLFGSAPLWERNFEIGERPTDMKRDDPEGGISLLLIETRELDGDAG